MLVAMAQIIQVVQVYGGDGVKPFVFGTSYALFPFVMSGSLPAFGALADKRLRHRPKQSYALKLAIRSECEPRALAIPRDHKFETFEIIDPNNEHLTHVFHDAKLLVFKPTSGEAELWIDIHCNGYSHAESLH